MLNENKFNYWALYCEENIWHLCAHPDFTQLKTCVVFISNEAKSCALWQQRAALAPDQPVIWDYHVVLLVQDHGWEVWDLDSALGLAVTLDHYLSQTFVRLGPDFGGYAPKFKLVDGETFKTRFFSDRSHMKNGEGIWLSPPPPWPAILQPNGLTLAELLDMSADQCLTLAQLRDLQW